MQKFLALGFDTTEAEMLSDAYDAITRKILWQYFRHPSTPGPDGFMFNSAIELAILATELKVSHSGASFAWTMRQMEAIAKGGWTPYCNRIRMVKAAQQLRHEENLARLRSGIQRQPSPVQ